MVEQIAVVPILIFSVIIHEIAHGVAALRLGDPTAKESGRLTLNPGPHIDPVGSLIVPIFSLIATGQVFIAWAKPVPINPANFRNPRKDDMLVSVVGPLSNFLLAFVSAVVFVIVSYVVPRGGGENSFGAQASHFVLSMFWGGMVLNIVLGVFNLIPVPPLDGSHLLAAVLPPDLSRGFRRIGFAGIFLILLLLRWQPFLTAFDGIIGVLLAPLELMIRTIGP